MNIPHGRRPVPHCSAVFGTATLTLAIFGFAIAVLLMGAVPGAGHGHLDPGVPVAPVDGYVAPRGYVCYGAEKNGGRGPEAGGGAGLSAALDGKLDKPAWQAVPWTEDFVDIEGGLKPRPRFRTRA